MNEHTIFSLIPCRSCGNDISADAELMRWMPPPDGIECAKVVLLEPR